MIGRRSGEFHAHGREQIDLEKNIITCHESFNFFTKSIGPTKGRYWRTIPISERLREFLVEHKARSKTSFVFDRTKAWDNGEPLNLGEYLVKQLRIWTDVFISLSKKKGLNEF